MPVVLWKAISAFRMPETFVVRFFAGFCLVANGAYIAVASIDRVGDGGEMLRRGSQMWQLWLFGALAVPLGIWIWHGQGVHFGLGRANGKVSVRVANVTPAVAFAFVVLGFTVGG